MRDDPHWVIPRAWQAADHDPPPWLRSLMCGVAGVRHQILPRQALLRPARGDSGYFMAFVHADWDFVRAPHESSPSQVLRDGVLESGFRGTNPDHPRYVAAWLAEVSPCAGL